MAGATLERRAAASTTIVRPLAGTTDDQAVRRLFRATLGFGTPVLFPLPGLARYECLCLDWYLGPGRGDAAVLDRDGEVVGYVLVGTDPAAHEAALRDEAVRFTTWAAPRVALRRLPEPARTFWRLRLVDGWHAWRHGRRTGGPPVPAHVHMNLDPSAKATRRTLDLLHHADDRVAAAGLPGWFGEINAVVGRRASALERVVGAVVDRQPNRTFTWLAGRPVERLTVVRRPQPQSVDGQRPWWLRCRPCRRSTTTWCAPAAVRCGPSCSTTPPSRCPRPRPPGSASDGPRSPSAGSARRASPHLATTRPNCAHAAEPDERAVPALLVGLQAA